MAARSVSSPSHISGYSGVSYPASLAFSIGQPIISKSYKYLAPSKNFQNACIIAFVGAVFFMVAFISPYWLVSYMYTYNPFKNMGLWEFCFDGYRYPKYQFDHKFTGCNYIFASEYRIIWEWMLPVWLMATQTFMSLALICILVGIVVAGMVLVRWPMQTVMRYEWHLIGGLTIMLGSIVVCLFFSVLVFGVKCWSRDWLQNPNFNYLSWSYYFAVFSGGFFAFAGLMMLFETFEARERKRQANNLLQMDPQPYTHQLGNGSEPQEIPIDPQYQSGYPMGPNPGFSREQSLHSQASAHSQPYQFGGYI